MSELFHWRRGSKYIKFQDACFRGYVREDSRSENRKGVFSIVNTNDLDFTRNRDSLSSLLGPWTIREGLDPSKLERVHARVYNPRCYLMWTTTVKRKGFCASTLEFYILEARLFLPIITKYFNVMYDSFDQIHFLSFLFYNFIEGIV